LRLTGASFHLSGELSETYSSNGYGIGTVFAGPGQSDFITTLGLNADAHDHTLRFDGDLSYSGYGDIYARRGDIRLINYLNALALATLVPEHLFFRASAFATPTLVNRLGPIGADGRFAAAGPNSGIRNAYGYTLAPVLTFRLGDFANSQTVVSQSAVLYTNPGGPEITQPVPGIGPAPVYFNTYSATETLSSGSDFARLGWSLSGSGSKVIEDRLRLEEAVADATLKYAITRTFTVTATGGYESISSNVSLSQRLTGLIAMGGFQYSPNPDFNLTANGGIQFNTSSFTGNLFYRLGGSTYVTASLSDAAGTPTSRLFGSLSSIGLTGTGQFFNGGVGPIGPPPPNLGNVAPFNPVPADVGALNSAIVRYRTANAALVHTDERTQYSLSVFRSEYHTLNQTDAPRTNNSTGATLAASRNISLRFRGTADVTYSHDDYFGARYNYITADVGLGYSLSPVTQVYGNARFIDRAPTGESSLTPVGGNATDVVVTIGIRRQFL
jgi:hypothetical protein